ncbi:hypothetical protein BaRGS_00028234 [Batillaria attramentaria]|uniref:RING-type domain-containing protein n=1 Tax=Batillaria attramentaria TaxID=370345 RepID=A0ABD0JZD5_9CAEN
MAFTVLRRPRKFTDCFRCRSLCLAPKILPCGHVVCLKCLLETSPRSAKCPTCGEWIFAAQGRDPMTTKQLADRLPTDHLMEMSVYEELRSAQPEPCTICPNVQATHICLNCRELYCTQDAKTHSKMDVAKDHIVMDLSCLIVQPSAQSIPPECADHVGTVAYSYCRIHNVYFCRDCATAHRQCLPENKIRIPMQQGKRDGDLQFQVADLDKQKSDVSMRQIQLTQAAEKVRHRREDAKKVVKDTFEELIAALRNRRDQLLSTVEESAEKTIQELEEGIRSCEHNQDLLNAYSANLRTMKSDGILMGTYDNLLHRLERIKMDSASPIHNTQKAEWPVATFDQPTIEQLKRDVSTIGIIKRTSKEERPDTAFSTTRGNISSTQPSGSVTTNVTRSSGKPSLDLRFSISPTDNTDAASVITAVLVTDGGRLVMADQSDKSVKVTMVTKPDTYSSIALEGCPYSLALLRDGTVAVTSSPRNIHFLDVTTRPVERRKIETERSYRGVGCLSRAENDELVVSSVQDDNKRACVDIISLQGNVLRRVLDGNTFDQLCEPLHLCVTGNEVVISEHEFHKILRLDLNISCVDVRSVSHNDVIYPCQISAGRCGKIFVACFGRGLNRGCVLVASPDGAWQRLLDSSDSGDRDDESGRVRARPEGVAVTSDGVIVVWSRQGFGSLVTKFRFP